MIQVNIWRCSKTYHIIIRKNPNLFPRAGACLLHFLPALTLFPHVTVGRRRRRGTPPPPLPHAAVDIAVACAVVAVAPRTDTLRCSLSLQQVKLLIRARRCLALLPPHASFRRKFFQRRGRTASTTWTLPPIQVEVFCLSHYNHLVHVHD